MNIMPFDFEEVEAASRPPVYPEGDYILHISNVEVINGETANPRLYVTCNIVLGPWLSEVYVGKTLKTAYSLTHADRPFLERLYKTCGFNVKELRGSVTQLNPEWLVGKRYIAQVCRQGGKTAVTNERQDSAAAPKSRPVAPKVGLLDRIKEFISRLPKASKQFLKVLREG